MLATYVHLLVTGAAAFTPSCYQLAAHRRAARAAPGEPNAAAFTPSCYQLAAHRRAARAAPALASWEDDPSWGDDTELNGGMSVVRATDALAAEEAEGTMDEVDALLSQWQDMQALADSSDDGVPGVEQQAKMLGSWRKMLADREAALRRDRRLSATKWLPGHLASWAGGAPQDEKPKPQPSKEERAASTAKQVAEADDEDDEFVFAWQSHTEGLRRAAAAELAATVRGPRT